MRILWGCLAAAILVPLAALFFLVMNPVWRDDARLDALRERVYAYSRPPQTEVDFPGESDAILEKNARGSGDYCAYRVRMTMRTPLTADEIRAYYRKAEIPGADEKGAAQISLWFEDPVDGAPERRAIVEVSDTHDSDWEIRCT